MLNVNDKLISRESTVYVNDRCKNMSPLGNENILKALTTDFSTSMVTQIKDITVDTANTGDYGWETAICSKKTHWIVVERYRSKENAKLGHEKYVAMVNVDKREFFSIQLDEMETLQ